MRLGHFDMLPERAFQRVGTRMTLEGGSGGGGNGNSYYDNMNRLYGVQSQAAQYMLDNSMPYIPQYMSNSSQMVAEANNGSLNNKMRSIAEDNATTAAGQSTEAMNQNLARYGVNPNSGAFADMNLKNSVGNAANTAKAKNDAGMWVEDQKWNRNAGALGQATGMGTGAMQSTGQAATGYSVAGGNQAMYGAANAAGYGKFGSALAGSAFKDGGAVEGKRGLGLAYAKGGAVKKCGTAAKPGLHMAVGGGVPSSNPWAAYQNNNPIQTGQQGNGGSNPFGSIVTGLAMGAAPMVIGKGVKYGLSTLKDAMTPVKDGQGTLSNISELERSRLTEQGLDNAKNNWPTAPVDPSSAVEPSSAPVDAVADKTADAVASNVGEAVAKEAADEAASNIPGVGSFVGAGLDAAKGNYLKAGLRLAGDTLVPGLGTATSLGLSLAGVNVANGGAIKRKNMKPGGAVSGPGTGTSDDVPAWLSDGEHVQNDVSASLIGLNTLDAINNEGLKVREGKTSAAAAKKRIGQILDKRGDELSGDDEKPGLHMAFGGNVGIALGAAADEWDKQKQLGMAQSLTDLRLNLAKPQLDTLGAQTASAQSTYDLNIRRNQDAQADADRNRQTSSVGYIGRNLGAGNQAGAIDEGNKYLATDSRYSGRKATGFTPTQGGVNMVLDDGTEIPFSNEYLKQGIQHVDNTKYEKQFDPYSGTGHSFNPKTGQWTVGVQGSNTEGRNKTPTAIQVDKYYRDQGQLTPQEMRSRDQYVLTARRSAMPGQEEAAAESALREWHEANPSAGKPIAQPAQQVTQPQSAVNPGIGRLIGVPQQQTPAQPTAPQPAPVAPPVQKPVSSVPPPAPVQQVAEAQPEPVTTLRPTSLGLSDINSVAPRIGSAANGYGLANVRTGRSSGSHSIDEQRAKTAAERKQHDLDLAKSDYEQAKADFEYAKEGSVLKESRRNRMNEAKARLDSLSS